MKGTHDQVTNLKGGDSAGYLLNDYEDAAIRFEDREGQNVWFLKFKGEKEFQVERSHRLVTDAILENATITREEYEAF
ncbi:hypothetical protein DYBT9623_04434 [Dyadobacter sp. CECT 9623]|uniref:Uncharacterized protein n=1 Tax=Dyadobacter linearis TaxID=2823330 RepID=A0ABN7RCF5_9BACT|nr:hypothetical protein [Dyadobacter sp. CECT 9623]CAG5072896.1 hypothetical protein DYBT9623_04434 [Dyadobacter sp. CECT 9623]